MGKTIASIIGLLILAIPFLLGRWTARIELKKEIERKNQAIFELRAKVQPYESASANQDVVDAYVDSECYSEFVSAINKRGYDIVTLPLVKAKTKE